MRTPRIVWPLAKSPQSRVGVELHVLHTVEHPEYFGCYEDGRRYKRDHKFAAEHSADLLMSPGRCGGVLGENNDRHRTSLMRARQLAERSFLRENVLAVVRAQHVLPIRDYWEHPRKRSLTLQRVITKRSDGLAYREQAIA